MLSHSHSLSVIRLPLLLVLATLLAATGIAQDKTAKTLDIYFVDAEGGLAALYVSPSGESLVIDTGSPGGRDTDRLMAVLTAAGVKQIDQLILTHYHGDHVGGLEELAKRIPIKHFTDHGPTGENTPGITKFLQMYEGMYTKDNHTVAKPGAKIPVAGLNVEVVTSGMEVLK